MLSIGLRCPYWGTFDPRARIVKGILQASQARVSILLERLKQIAAI